jgi:hypothetical protein
MCGPKSEETLIRVRLTQITSNNFIKISSNNQFLSNLDLIRGFRMKIILPMIMPLSPKDLKIIFTRPAYALDLKKGIAHMAPNVHMLMGFLNSESVLPQLNLIQQILSLNLNLNLNLNLINL